MTNQTPTNQQPISQAEIESRGEQVKDGLTKATKDVILASGTVSKGFESNTSQNSDRYIKIYDLCSFMKRTFYHNWDIDGDDELSPRFRIINEPLEYELDKLYAVLDPIHKKIKADCENINVYVKTIGIYGGFTKYNKTNLFELITLAVRGGYFLNYYANIRKDTEKAEVIDEELNCYIYNALEMTYIERDMAETIFNYPKKNKGTPPTTTQISTDDETERLKKELERVKAIQKAQDDENERLKKENDELKKENDELKTNSRANNTKKTNSRKLGAITRENNSLKLTVYGMTLMVDDIYNGRDINHLFSRGVTYNAIATYIKNRFNSLNQSQGAELKSPSNDTIQGQVEKGESIYKENQGLPDDYEAETIIKESEEYCNL